MLGRNAQAKLLPRRKAVYTARNRPKTSVLK
jgi:hypothetical protein